MPAFTTMRTVANIFLQGASTLSSPLLPDIVRLKASNELSKLETLMRSLAALTSYTMSLAMIVALPMLPTAYEIWTRGHTAFNSPLYALLAGSVLVRVFGNPCIALIFGLNALGPQFATAALQFATTLGVAVLLVPIDGVRGAGLAILLGEIIGSLVVPWMTLRIRFPELTALVSFKKALIAAAPGTLVVGLLIAHAYLGTADWQTTAIGIVTLLVMAIPLWHSFSQEVRDRLLRLARVRS